MGLPVVVYRESPISINNWLAGMDSSKPKGLTARRLRGCHQHHQLKMVQRMIKFQASCVFCDRPAEWRTVSGV